MTEMEMGESVTATAADNQPSAEDVRAALVGSVLGTCNTLLHYSSQVCVSGALDIEVDDKHLFTLKICHSMVRNQVQESGISITEKMMKKEVSDVMPEDLWKELLPGTSSDQRDSYNLVREDPDPGELGHDNVMDADNGDDDDDWEPSRAGTSPARGKRRSSRRLSAAQGSATSPPVKRELRVAADMGRDSQQEAHVCSECSETFPFRDMLIYHMAMQHAKERRKSGRKTKHLCELCKDTFKTKRDLVKHKKSHIASSSEPKSKDGPTGDEDDDEGKGVKPNNKRKKKSLKMSCSDNGKKFKSGSDLEFHSCSVEETKMPLVKCDKCQATFDGNVNLEAHIEQCHAKGTESKTGEYTCTDCGAVFTSQQEFKDHVSQVHRRGQKRAGYTCVICNKVYTAELKLHQHHLKMHFSNLEEHPFLCCLCTPHKPFGGNESLMLHKIKVHGENDNSGKFKKCQCDVCYKVFYKVSDMERHKMIHTKGEHAAYQMQRPECAVCGKDFNNKYDLKRHEKIHTGERPYMCEFCGKGFLEKRNLQNHMLQHTGDKPFKCDRCGKQFCSNHDLVRHTRTHTGERPFVCEICGKGFSENRNLTRHLMIHTDERPFKCQDCSKWFRSKQEVDIHRRAHTGEKPYKCDFCNKAFSQKTAWIYHQDVHSDDRPFRCEVCGKAFKRKETLQIHGISHTDVKAFTCLICTTAFKYKISYKAHMKKYHGDNSANRLNIHDKTDVMLGDPGEMLTALPPPPTPPLPESQILVPVSAGSLLEQAPPTTPLPVPVLVPVSADSLLAPNTTFQGFMYDNLSSTA